MPPDELDVEVEAADILDGELPGHYQPVQPEPPQMPGGEAFERGLEAAKRGYEIGPDGELTRADDPARKKRSGPKLS
jgi:hypothetical protein